MLRGYTIKLLPHLRLDLDNILLRSRCLYAADGEDVACECLFSELVRRDHQRYLFEAAKEMLSAGI